MAVFTWTPSKMFTKKVKPRVKVIQFGDGYSQRVPETINNLEAEWSLTFSNRGLIDAAALISFLETHTGSEAFNWTPTGDSTSVAVYCPERREH